MRLLKLTWISLHWVEIFPLFWKTVRICAVLLFRFFFLLIARLWRSTCINSELEHLFVQIALVKVSTIMVANTSVKNVWDHVCTFISCHLNMLHFELSLQMELRHKWIHVSDGCTKFWEGSYQSPSGWESVHTEENLHQMGQCLPRKGKE